ncbi:hypothetical protein ABIB25_004358 [Nakamurella sp. UYEF19]|uniref:hypothetical protein n=1 Tax=Nakamurella sp. UYEF19 TaxID=1756392 RepID=UPI0033918822
MTASFRPPTRPSADLQTVLLRRLLAVSWSSLPVLLGASVCCCLGFTLVLLCGPGPTPAGVVVMGVLVIPAFTLLLRTYHRALFGAPAGHTAGLPGSARRWSPRACWAGFWLPTLRITGVPVVAGCLALVAWQMWAQTGQWWALGPLAVCVAVTVVSTVAAVLALTLREADRRLTTVQLWTTALTLMARQPIPSASTVVLPAAGLWACLHLTASLVLVVPLPAAFVLVAAVWTSGEGQSLLATTGPDDIAPENSTTAPGSQW